MPTPVAAESQEAASSDLLDAAAHDALVSTALDYSIVPGESASVHESERVCMRVICVFLWVCFGA